MEFLDFVRGEPVMGWFAFLALLITLVPLASVRWRTKFPSSPEHKKMRPVQEVRSTHFGNRTEILILLVVLVCLIALIGGILGISG